MKKLLYLVSMASWITNATPLLAVSTPEEPSEQ